MKVEPQFRISLDNERTERIRLSERPRLSGIPILTERKYTEFLSIHQYDDSMFISVRLTGSLLMLMFEGDLGLLETRPMLSRICQFLLSRERVSRDESSLLCGKNSA